MNLYSVKTRDDKFYCPQGLYENVSIQWAYNGAKRELDYSKLIENYDGPNSGYEEAAVDQMFTLQEADLLEEQLNGNKEWKNSTTEVVREKTPLCDRGPISPDYCNINCAHYLHKGNGYNLPFNVVGYYDVTKFSEARYIAPTFYRDGKWQLIKEDTDENFLFDLKEEMNFLVDELNKIKKLLNDRTNPF